MADPNTTAPTAPKEKYTHQHFPKIVYCDQVRNKEGQPEGILMRGPEDMDAAIEKGEGPFFENPALKEEKPKLSQAEQEATIEESQARIKSLSGDLDSAEKEIFARGKTIEAQQKEIIAQQSEIKELGQKLADLAKKAAPSADEGNEVPTLKNQKK